VEVERKWLVRELPPGFDDLPSRVIRQGYVALEPDGREVRVRDDAGKYVLTVKSAGDVARSEDEIELSEQQFATLWPLTEGRRIEKVRAECRLTDDALAEIDVYRGDLAPLIVAEVEFDSEAAADAFGAPHWMGEEVTKDARFKNRNLALRGL
jgi:CYTH domain-containing protein